MGPLELSLAVLLAAQQAAAIPTAWRMERTGDLASGARSCALVSSFGLRQERGFGRGFDRYRSLPAVDRQAVRRELDPWLAELAEGDPWFLWLAFNAAHAPFHKPPEELHGFDLPEDIGRGDYLEFGRLGAYSLSGRTDFNGRYSDRIVLIDALEQVPPGHDRYRN